MARARPTWYLDTSAALKLVVEEDESAALAGAIRDADAALVSTTLLETEMRRAAHRIPPLTQAAVTAFLRDIDLYEMPAALFAQAGLLPGPSLRALDALHLAAAIALRVEALASYDARLVDAAAASGVPAVQPR